MKQDKEYQVIKAIPLGNGKEISKGTKDFDLLIEKEEIDGWQYICPVVKKRAFGNSKETI